MKKLSEQSEISKQHFAAGAISASALNEALMRKNFARTTLSMELTRDNLIEIMNNRVEMELKSVRVIMTEEMGFEAAEKWVNNIRKIIDLSGCLESALELYL